MADDAGMDAMDDDYRHYLEHHHDHYMPTLYNMLRFILGSEGAYDIMDFVHENQAFSVTVLIAVLVAPVCLSITVGAWIDRGADKDD